MRILKKLPVVLLLIVALGMPQLAAAAERNRPSQEATQAYVVVFEEHVSTSAGRRAAEDAGGDVVNTYEGTFTGATVEMTPSEVERLRSDGRVKSVVEEPEFTIAAQTVPTGIRRVDTPGIDNNGPDLSSVHIAVLDTGIDLSHPDLNVGSGINCVNPSASPNDDHGHGTHVAGTIAAKDNNIGVVGVAPGAVVHPVKVLNSAGSSVSGSLGCGLQWVLNNASMIDVVNMSLGGSTSLRDEDNCGLSNGDAFHQWVCAIVNAGITVVVAAGNNNQTTTYKIPARYREAVTVSALADYDGLPGGLANSSDDKMASFSNFGSHVDVIAPGVSILSTTRGGSYGYMSGTSMAAPHAAGAAAAYIAQNGGASPAQVDGALKSTGTFDWTGDKDQWKEPLINVRQLLGGGSGGGATIDASVNQVAASPTTIALNGGNVTITATVGNNGTSSATIPVGVTGPNGYSSSQNVSVSAGATTQVSFSWPASVTGSHTFTVTTNLAGDQNSANNQGTSPTVTVSGSSSPTVVDAEVVSLKASSTSVSQGGSAVTFTANVRNNGTSSASIAVRLTSGSASVNTTKSVTLGAGKSTNVTFQWSPSVVGTHSFTATAVLANDSKPSNNSKSVNVTVNQQAAKHIYVSQTSATKTATGWRVTLTLGSSNGNVGAGATIKVSVRDQFGRTRAYTVKTQSNGSATFAVSRHTTSTHTLTITSITYSGHTYNAALNKGVPMTLTI